MGKHAHTGTAAPDYQWKASKDPQYTEKKARVGHLYAIADREVAPVGGDLEIVFCLDEFGPAG